MSREPKRPDWPFGDPPSAAVFTVKAILEKRAPILSVTHDEEDGAWQFHTGRRMRLEDARLLRLHEVVELDPTVRDLCDLPLGWTASRESPSSPWKRERRSTVPTTARRSKDARVITTARRSRDARVIR